VTIIGEEFLLQMELKNYLRQNIVLNFILWLELLGYFICLTEAIAFADQDQ